MRKWIICLVGACALFARTPSALAVLNAFWIRNAISQAAIVNDPQLVGMQSWSLWVTYDTGNWASAVMRATLPAGSVYYQNAVGTNTAPNAGLFEQFPAVEFDTYVTDPTRISTLILGGHPASPTASLGGPNDPIPGTFSVSWGNLTVDAPASYEIARLTFPLGVLPTILEGGPHLQSETYTVNPDATAPIPQVPEPAGALALASCSLALVLRADYRAGCRTRRADRR